VNEIDKIIKKLELQLLHSDVRNNPELLNELLSEDFEEIGNIGKVSSREEVVEWLLTKDKDTKWTLNEFRVREITSKIVLAIYRVTKDSPLHDKSKGSIRSSIWKKYDDGWKMTFHQGTKILDT
jgi:hypothetical protein